MNGKGFTDAEAKATCQTECDKRNKSISKFHPMRWKPLFTPDKGWCPALRPAVTVEKVVKRPRSRK